MKKKAKHGSILQFANEDTQAATLTGTIYRKQVAKFGKWVNPDYPWFSDDPSMTLDESWGEKIVENFKSGALGSKVPVPLNHTDDVKANAGEVVGLEVVDGDGLYAELHILDDDTIEKLEKGLIFDVSISFAWDFVDTKDGVHHGPVLLHVALVNTPYLIGMDKFEKVGEALHRLSDVFKPVGLALEQGASAIMLSRTKAKELLSMETATIKNEKDFDVTINVTRDGEEVEEVVKAGEEVEIPTEQAEDITTQLAEAVEDGEEEAEEEQEEASIEGGEEEAEDEEGEEEEAEDSDDDDEEEEEEEQTELARVRAENAALKAEKQYETLLSAGKITPAQKDQFMSLSKLDVGEVQLSKDKTADLSTIVFDILNAGKQQFSTEEEGSGKEDEEGADPENSDEDKKPSEKLSESELAGMKAVGADPKAMDELAEKEPAFAEALEAMDNK